MHGVPRDAQSESGSYLTLGSLTSLYSRNLSLTILRSSVNVTTSSVLWMR